MIVLMFIEKDQYKNWRKVNSNRERGCCKMFTPEVKDSSASSLNLNFHPVWELHANLSRIFKVNISWQILFARTIGSVRADRVRLEKMPPGDYIPGVCSWTYHNKASYGPLSFERMSWCWCCCRKDWTLFCHFPIISQPMYVFHRQIDAAIHYTINYPQ